MNPDQPKPAEWTVERIHSYKCDGDLIEDINAALAAAWKEGYLETGEPWIGGNCKFCNEPDGKHKPDCRRPATVGEWTDLYVLELLGNPKNQGWSLHPDRIKSLIDAHNAALAAEREKVQLLKLEHREDIICAINDQNQLSAQLAALEGVLADDTGKSALAAAIKESYEKGRKDEQDQSSTLR